MPNRWKSDDIVRSIWRHIEIYRNIYPIYLSTSKFVTEMNGPKVA